MTIAIALDADPDWDSSTGQWADIADKALHAAVAESAYPYLAGSEREVEVSLSLSNDDEVRALNAQWRGKDKPTNVLSFPMCDAQELASADKPGSILLLGDMILARETCVREAADKGVSTEQHATHLMVHGMLHLLGYDHMDDGEAEDMEAREIRALHRLGLPDPYTLTEEAH